MRCFRREETQSIAASRAAQCKACFGYVVTREAAAVRMPNMAFRIEVLLAEWAH